MTHVKVAMLKSRLSEYLRQVRNGHEVLVYDRDTPIARLVPYRKEATRLKIRHPAKGAPRIQDVPLPPPLKIKGDIVTLLLEERQNDR
jgi:prevent-host-death family protein